MQPLNTYKQNDSTLPEQVTSRSDKIRAAIRAILRFFRVLLLVCMLLWSVGALTYFPVIPSWLGSIAGLGLLLMPWWIAKWVDSPEQRRSYIFLTTVGVMLLWLLIPPSSNRDWDEYHGRIAVPEITASSVSINDVRSFRYTSAGHRSAPDFTKAYLDLEIPIDQIEGMDIAVADLTAWRGPAHTMISFSYRVDDQLRYINVSAETRREKGESYSILRGFFKHYELIYVIADEQDALELRHAYGEKVRLYPVSLPKRAIRKIFVDVMNRARKLQSQPEFYHTITNNCTTQILKHISKVAENDISILNWRIIMASHSDELLFGYGMVDAELSASVPRDHFLTNERAESFVEGTDYSAHIRP